MHRIFKDPLYDFIPRDEQRIRPFVFAPIDFVIARSPFTSGDRPRVQNPGGSFKVVSKLLGLKWVGKETGDATNNSPVVGR